MRKASIFVMISAIVIMIVFGVAYYHPITDNAVDSDGFWAYMYGYMSVPWVVFAGGTIFLMGLTAFFATTEQKSQRS